MIFAAVAAFAMVSVSNVFAFNSATLANSLSQVNDTVDTTVVTPASPAPASVAPADSSVAPVDTTKAPADAPQAPSDTTKAPAASTNNTAE